MNEISIDLPLPHKCLSPNARVHWAAKSPEVKRHRRIAQLRTLQIRNGEKLFPPPSIIHYEIYRYSTKEMDDDNVIAMCKPYRDGIADALGINDKALKIRGVEQFVSSPKCPPRITIRLFLPKTNTKQ